MHQLENNTPFQAEKLGLVDKEGNQIWVVVVKATYVLEGDGTTEVAADQEPVCRCPRYAGEVGRSSLLREVELVAEHPGTDVTLLATAHAPNHRALPFLDVSVAVGTLTKTLRVFGDRVWQAGLLGPRMTNPEPFTDMPITYERAFGGTNVLGAGTDQWEKEPRNPIGTGFASRAGILVGKRLPNVEDPSDLIRKWNTRPRPAGLGPIPAFWSPRLEYAGTFDAEWEQTRMPLWPRDYDPRYAQAAPPNLVSPQPLRGGERVVLTNLTPDGHREFRLPRAYLLCRTETRTGSLRQQVQLDRVILEPDAGKILLVWRSSLNCRARIRDVLRTVVETKPYLR
jgi:hypothetical protein